MFLAREVIVHVVFTTTEREDLLLHELVVLENRVENIDMH